MVLEARLVLVAGLAALIALQLDVQSRKYVEVEAPLANATLYYFDARGRAEPVRLLLADAGVAYDEVRITPSEWRGGKKQQLTQSGTAVFGQLPAFQADGISLAQTQAILRHIARARDYYGANQEERALIDVLSGAYDDWKARYGRVVYNPDFDESMLRTFIEKDIPHILNGIETILHTHSGPYSLGMRVSFADFLLFELADLTSHVDASALTAYPNLDALHKAVAKRTNIAEYIRTRRPLRVNGSTAKFDTEERPAA